MRVSVQFMSLCAGKQRTSEMFTCVQLSDLMGEMSRGETPLAKSRRVGLGSDASQQVVKGGALPKLVALLQRTFKVAAYRGIGLVTPVCLRDPWLYA